MHVNADNKQLSSLVRIFFMQSHQTTSEEKANDTKANPGESTTHSQQNQLAYNQFWLTHSKLDSFHSTKFLAHRDLHQLIDQHLLQIVPKTKYRILDFGCGNGETASIISALFATFGKQVELYCLDKNEKNLTIAKEKNPNANCYLADENNFPQELKDFDLIICNFVLLENLPAAITMILENIQSTLSDQGIAIITHNTAKAYDEANRWVSFSTNFTENKRGVFDSEKNKYTRADGNPVTKAMVKDGVKLHTFYDFFYRRRTYRTAFTAANLDLITSHKPLGTSDDHIDWQSETSIAPYRIDILRRMRIVELELELEQNMRPF
jgi:ubiquinone/menaquinone biosynthesis C-methylase UbiE